MAQFGDGSSNLTDAIAAEISHHVSPIVGAWRYYDMYPERNKNGFQGHPAFMEAVHKAAEAIVSHLDLADGLAAPVAHQEAGETSQGI